MPGQIRIVGVKCRELIEDAALELHPARRRQRDACALDRNADQSELLGKTLDFVGAERMIASKGCEVDMTRGAFE